MLYFVSFRIKIRKRNVEILRCINFMISFFYADIFEKIYKMYEANKQ